VSESNKRHCAGSKKYGQDNLRMKLNWCCGASHEH